ncbi:MAG TPA: ester cyclase [Chloroflexia bacterium]|nr:ester cyclase [Chloroflexia bacterium]
MTDPTTVQRYLEAWQRRDPAAIVACFTADGTYSDPAGQGMQGEVLAGYASALFSAFPDFNIEALEHGFIGGDTYALQWVITGTQNGDFMGLPPTGRAGRLEGMDLIKLEGNKIKSVTGYWDTKTLMDQLGVQLVPAAVGATSTN